MMMVKLNTLKSGKYFIYRGDVCIAVDYNPPTDEMVVIVLGEDGKDAAKLELDGSIMVRLITNLEFYYDYI